MSSILSKKSSYTRNESVRLEIAVRFWSVEAADERDGEDNEETSDEEEVSDHSVSEDGSVDEEGAEGQPGAQARPPLCSKQTKQQFASKDLMH